MNEPTKPTPESVKQAEVDACLSRIYASTDVARTLLQHIQGETESQPHIYNMLEALDAVICRIGFTNSVLANRINPQLLGRPDPEEWMPVRHTEATPD
jgi:hypothetical protein